MLLHKHIFPSLLKSDEKTAIENPSGHRRQGAVGVSGFAPATWWS